MKKYTRIISMLLGFLLFTVIVYATVTTANSRKSPKLPWQGTPSGFYDSAHNVGTSYVAQSRFTCVSGTCNSTRTNTGVVEDSITGLYWQSGYPYPTYTWTNAKAYCSDLSLGGYDDWRLPTFKELESIVDLTVYEPSINTVYFSSGIGYWSSTTKAGFTTTTAWMIDFNNGASYTASMTLSYRVRCTR